MKGWFPTFLSLGIAISTPYSTFSKRGDGLIAVYLLLKELGYKVKRVTSSPSRLPEGMRAFFLVQPTEPLREGELDGVVKWVESGNVLIAAGGPPLKPLAERLGLKLIKGRWISESGAITDLLQKPELNLITVKTPWRLRIPSGRNDVAFLFGDEKGATVVMIRIGNGIAILISSPFPLTNAGLAYKENAAFLNNLLSFFPRGSEVGFDEYHHGLRTIGLLGGELISVSRFLTSPVGRAFAWIVAALLIFLTFRGRRLGSPLKRERETRRRPSSEYVISIARLYKMAGKRRAVFEHMREKLKKELIRRFGIDPEVGVDQLIKELRRRGSDIDMDRLERLLRTFNSSLLPPEDELLKMSKEIDELLGKER